MNCPNCAKSFPDSANFCSRCGRPLKVNPILDENIRWETCEIFWDSVPHWFYKRFKFWVRARGPEGEYRVMESEVLNGTGPAYSEALAEKSFPAHLKAYKRIVDSLLKAGWDQVTADKDTWYHDTFRRRVENK